MADLQHAILLLRELDQFGGLRGVVGHRFLDQDVFALLRAIALAMSKCVVVGVTMFSASLAAAASAMELKTRSIVFRGDFAGGFGVGVVNAGEFDLSGGGEFGINADVMLPERAGAEDGDFDL